MEKHLKRLIKRGINYFGFEVRRAGAARPKPRIFETHPTAEFKAPIFDLVVTTAMLRNSSFFFIQVGANDGVTNDPIYHLLADFNPHGVLLEPLPGPFEKLRSNYAQCTNLHFENAALSDHCGEKEIFLIKPEYAYDGKNGKKIIPDRLASFDPGHAKRYLGKTNGWSREAIDRRDMITSEKVRSITFDYIFEKYKPHNVDMLVVDAEGYDYSVLKLFDFEKFKPKIIYYEHSGLGEIDKEHCWSFVAGMGYKLHVSTSNTMAVNGTLP